MSRYLSQAPARGDQASRQLSNRLIDDARDDPVLGEERGMSVPVPIPRPALRCRWRGAPGC